MEGSPLSEDSSVSDTACSIPPNPFALPLADYDVSELVDLIAQIGRELQARRLAKKTPVLSLVVNELSQELLPPTTS